MKTEPCKQTDAETTPYPYCLKKPPFDYRVYCTRPIGHEGKHHSHLYNKQKTKCMRVW